MIMTAFDKAWKIVKSEEERMPPIPDDFNPDNDTCTGCGGQMTPHWPGYGPDGPDNGNCDSELPECDLNFMLQTMADGGHWGQMGLPHDWDQDSMIGWIHDERATGNQDFPDEQFYDRLLEDEK